MNLHLQILAAVTNLVLLIAVIPPVHSTIKSDSRALLDFANAVPHARKLNWEQNPDSVCSSWIGITCTYDKTRVDGIHLPGFGFFGSIPDNTIGRLDALRFLSLRSNYLNGTLPKDILSIPSLQFITLRYNNFSGDLPRSLSSNLTVIDLSFNSFSGEIPPAIKNLKRLSVLNLQFNLLYGNIPYFDLPRLKGLNLSHNSLNGSVPKPLRKFQISSFLGNDRLCGAPLDSCSSIHLPEESSFDLRKLSSRATIAMGASVIIPTFMAVLFFCLKRKLKGKGNTTSIPAKGKIKNLKPDDFGSGVHGAEKNSLVFFEEYSSSFDLDDLLSSSAEILGKGSYGTAYKAILDESTAVVVKRLKGAGIWKKEFEHQMEIAKEIVGHPNVVPILAYHSSKEEKLLVYKYMASGSLSEALHGNRGKERIQLDWDSRLKISMGAAKGLAHIHLQDGGKCIHGNIKSSNVFLSHGFDGHISDFGLSPMMCSFPAKQRSPGYTAPEVIETQKATQKSDVYSFGVVLLEILTGKYSIQVDLPLWVRSVVREEWTAEVFDVELTKGNDHVEEEMVQMLQIALSCVGKAADERPSMDEVVRTIEYI